MDPKLVAIDGPIKGQIIVLGGEEFSIGRDSANALALPSVTASRRHCLIRRDGDEAEITDLESKNGTFVNDVPVKKQRLQQGDRIRIGDSLFLFLLRDERESTSLPPVVVQEEGMEALSTLEISIEEARKLHYGKPEESPPETERLARNLSSLVKISMAVNSIRNVKALQSQVLDCIFEVVPADRGAVLLAGGNPEGFQSVFGSTRGAALTRPFHVSQTIIQRVMREGVALLSNDVVDSEQFRDSASLKEANTRSVLAVPLVVQDQKQGVIYLDSSDPQDQFDEGHLQLLTAVAGIAALAFENARQVERLENENLRLQTDISRNHSMVGESPAMHKVHEFIAKVASADSTVLITGASGTGKELVARAIHESSPRFRKPYVAINCATLAEALMESELFGHERGAFTGAVTQKKGKMEVADGGTLVLDEIGDLAPGLQAKLLRVLQDHEFDRVGGTRKIKVDVRVIAVTNRDLKKAVKDGSFREDLFYRIHVVSLEVPTLRKRPEDIPLLARYFADQYGSRCKRRLWGISDEAMECLMNYSWPGNIRELENAIEHAVVLGSSEFIRPEELPESVLESRQSGEAVPTQYHQKILETKKKVILEAFQRAKGSYVEAAKLLGVHPNYLHRLVRNMNLKDAVKKAP